jgi:adrenodoxin-NADP+ reductase
MRIFSTNNLLKLFHKNNLLHRLNYSNDSAALRTCVVGSGPAGFYSSQYLLKHLPNAKVDMIEKLPVPFGLGRRRIKS